jgi:hypothetical protein
MRRLFFLLLFVPGIVSAQTKLLSGTALGSSHGEAIYGDGSDGSVRFDGTTTILGMAPSSSVYTLTRDITCSGITVSSGVTIKTANYRIFCTGTLTDSGAIQANGNNAVTTTPGAAIPSSSGVYLGSTAGGAGRTTTGVGNGSTSVSFECLAAAGGNGGTGGGINTGGGAGVTSFVFGTLHTPSVWLSPIILTGAATISGARGASGGGGGGLTLSIGSPTSGAGGGGAGVLLIASSTLVNRGTISANGGNGSNAVDSGGDNGGGGGGGGGGGVCLIYDSFTGNAATATGGSHGTGIGTGANGSDGSAGNVINIQN